MRWQQGLGGSALATILLTACSVSKDEGAATGDAAGSGSTEAAADLVPEEAGPLDRMLNNGKPLRIDAQLAHPNGLVVQLRSVQVKPTETVVGVTFVNGDSDEQKLNYYSNNKDGYIVTGDGQKFYLSPPPTNLALSIQPGQQVDGELVFIGRVPAGQNAVLVLNEGGSPDSNYSNNPQIRIALPLGVAAFSDDGSKKN